MSVAAGCPRLFDRRFAVGLFVLAGICAVTVPLRGASVSVKDDGTLSGSYAQFANYNLVAFAYVPVFAFCVSGAVEPLDSAVWVSRSTRMEALLGVVVRLVVRAVAFSALLALCCLLGARLFSPTGYAAGDYLALGLLAVALQALFFLVVGLVILVVRLITNTAAYAALAAFGYGALDYLLGMTPALYNSALWTGWLLATVMPEDGLVAEGLGALRLAAGCVTLGLLAAHLVRKRDYLPKEGKPREL